MTFVNLSLLAGGILIAAPIILHLMMRRKPTLMEFPALRFLQKRHDANQRRLQIRHLLLLMLRIAIIGLLAFALARPSLRLSGAMGSQEAPVAAALVFDVAPHMGYRHENQTRLEAARELGGWLLAQLPENSEIAVLDTRLGTAAAFQQDRGAAQERLGRLEVTSNAQPIPTTIVESVKLLRQSTLDRKELYVFTDLSQGAWASDKAAHLQQQLGDLNDVGIYVIDVGVTHPIDYGLTEVHLSSEILSSRSALTIETQLSCLGDADPRTVALYLLDANRRPRKRSEQTCEPRLGELEPIAFRIGGLEPGTHQGFVQIIGQDGLAADDTRFFTIVVQPAWRILIAAPQPADRYAFNLAQSLAPEESRKRGQAQFDCDICDLNQLANRSLDDYAAVFLLDPTAMEPALWKKLTDYVADGRGLAVALGKNAAPIDSFNTDLPQGLLAGKLLRQVPRKEGDTYLTANDNQHPILSEFRGLDIVPWAAFPVLRYWELNAIASGVNAVMFYSDGRPAILERPVGRGRTLTITTPFSDQPDKKAWNLLLIGDDWPFLILANRMASYLVGGGDLQLNYLAGHTAVLKVDDIRLQYLLTPPDGSSYSITADPSRRALSVPSVDQVGNYRVQAGGAAGIDLGFSINYALEQTRLDRLTDQELAGMFGPIKYRLARTREQIDRDISTGRVGRELFPPLILLLALLLGIEMLIANRFYRDPSSLDPHQPLATDH